MEGNCEKERKMKNNKKVGQKQRWERTEKSEKKREGNENEIDKEKDGGR